MPEHEPHETPRSNQWQLTLIVSALCLILFSLFLTPTSSTSQSYSEFIDLVESDRVERVIISPDGGEPRYV